MKKLVLALFMLGMVASCYAVTYVDVVTNWLFDEPCIADLNNDEIVNFVDFAITLPKVDRSNVYVSPTGSDTNLGNGESDSDAYQTIIRAISTVDAGGTIWLVDGVYDSTTQGDTFFINLPAKTFTMQSLSQDASSVTLKTKNANYCVNVSENNVNETVEIKDITINPETSPALGIAFWNNNIASKLIFTDCVITAGTSLVANTGTDTSKDKEITFDGCTITSSNSHVFSLRDTGLIWIKNCDITTTGWGTTIFLSGEGTGDFNRVFVDDNTFTVGNVKVLDLNWATNFDYVRFNGNTITNCTAWVYLRDTPSVGQIDVSNNSGTSQYGSNTIAIGINAQNNAQITEAVNEYSDVRIMGNSITKTSTALTGHPILIGSNTNGAEVSYNKCVYAHQSDFGIVIKGNRTSVHHNYVNGGDSIYINAGSYNKVFNNTCIANGKAAFIWSYIETTSGTGNKVYDNIFDGTDGLYAIRDIVRNDWDILIDGNIYISGSSGVFHLDGAGRNTIAEIQNVWTGGYSTNYSDLNDQNSQVLTRDDVAFKNLSNHNFELLPSSHALNMIKNQGSNGIDFGWNSVGAWQPFSSGY